ncbi:hypothetical protein AAEH72_07410 [Shewanella xiamenensis]|uniref:hypothetical protein n=1 Tax=Shewanella xiamenensis TaxID=332186 RepID=UPI00313EA7A9
MNVLTGKKVLFICPRFFGYEHEIELELRRLGAHVDFYDERPFSSSIAKIFNRLNFKTIIKKQIQDYYSEILQQATKVKYDYLFVIAPETMTANFILDFKSKNNKVKTILYLWDSIENKKNALGLVQYFDKVVTFDKNDSIVDHKIAFLPLFYIEAYGGDYNAKRKLSYDLAFIGTAHSGRYNLVNQIVENIQSENTNNFLFFFSPSKLLFLLKKILTNELSGISIKNISFQPMAFREVINILGDSRVVIDIEHPSQNGLTMRTIEMLGMQKKLITTNKNVMEYDFYNPVNILVVDRKDLSIDTSFLRTEYQPVDAKIRENYSLSSWLMNLFS